MSFVEYQSNIFNLVKNIAMTTQDMVHKTEVNPSDLVNQLTGYYDLLASNSENVAVTPNISYDVSRMFRVWAVKMNVNATLKV